MAFAETYETRWADPEWHAEARACVEERLADEGREITGELEQPLLEDAGERLRELESMPGRLERWASAVARYAGLQRVAAPDADSFVAAGAVDRRGPLLLEQFAEFLEDDVALLAGLGVRLRLRRLIELCA